jgi:xanthine dehydrogenase YagR molybdenum-binding subunit
MSQQPQQQQGQAAQRNPEQAQQNPGPSLQQAMLYGVVGDGLKEVTRRVPLDEPPPLADNSKLKSIGKRSRGSDEPRAVEVG